MNSVQRSIFFSALERYASLLLFLVSTAVLSRLLTAQGVRHLCGRPRDHVGVLGLVPGIRRRQLSHSESIAVGSQRQDRLYHHIWLVRRDRASPLSAGWRSRIDARALTVSRAGIAVAVLNFVITPFSMTIIALLSSRHAVRRRRGQQSRLQFHDGRACRSRSRRWAIAILRRSGE